ncbi:hypothetical protein [Planococcus sp. YIM B11945]
MVAIMFIEAGEPLYLLGSMFFIFFIGLMLGMFFGSYEEDNKKTN